MHTEILTGAQIAVLDRLKEISDVSEFYLAGGTALALRHGHRRSIDFDFFRQDAFDGFNLIAKLDDSFTRLEKLPSGERTVHVRLDDVSASFFQLKYPLIAPAEPTPWGFVLASDYDIAAMKLEAIAGRGSRKDFIDLRLLCRQGMTIAETFDLFEKKYGTAPGERYHRLRALVYFDDAEAQPMPDMIEAFDWAEAKRFFEAEATRLMNSELDKR